MKTYILTYVDICQLGGAIVISKLSHGTYLVSAPVLNTATYIPIHLGVITLVVCSYFLLTLHVRYFQLFLFAYKKAVIQPVIQNMYVQYNTTMNFARYILDSSLNSTLSLSLLRFVWISRTDTKFYSLMAGIVISKSPLQGETLKCATRFQQNIRSLPTFIHDRV